MNHVICCCIIFEIDLGKLTIHKGHILCLKPLPCVFESVWQWLSRDDSILLATICWYSPVVRMCILCHLLVLGCHDKLLVFLHRLLSHSTHIKNHPVQVSYNLKQGIVNCCCCRWTSRTPAPILKVSEMGSIGQPLEAGNRFLRRRAWFGLLWFGFNS